MAYRYADSDGSGDEVQGVAPNLALCKVDYIDWSNWDNHPKLPVYLITPDAWPQFERRLQERRDSNTEQDTHPPPSSVFAGPSEATPSDDDPSTTGPSGSGIPVRDVFVRDPKMNEHKVENLQISLSDNQVLNLCDLKVFSNATNEISLLSDYEALFYHESSLTDLNISVDGANVPLSSLRVITSAEDSKVGYLDLAKQNVALVTGDVRPFSSLKLKLPGAETSQAFDDGRSASVPTTPVRASKRRRI